MEHITSHGFSIKQLLRILTLAPSSTGFVRRLSTGTRVLAVDISSVLVYDGCFVTTFTANLPFLLTPL